MPRPKKIAAAPAVPDEVPSDQLLVKSADLLFMRDNFISGLSHLEQGVNELRRAYVTQFNTLLPEGHAGRLHVFPGFGDRPPALPVAPRVDPMGAVPGANFMAAQLPAAAAASAPAAAPAAGDGAAAPEANMKRKRKPHDPNAPKRALTSYFLFMQNNKPQIKELHPDWSAQQVSDESENRWRDISDKERADYDYMYQVDLARYYKQKECYEAGEPIPDIGADEAKRLYQEHLKRGVPFKGRKGKKAEGGRPNESSDDDAPQRAAPTAPKAKRQKTSAAPAKASAPFAAAAPAPMAPAAPMASAADATPKSDKKKGGRKSKGAAAAAGVDSTTPAPLYQAPPAPMMPLAPAMGGFGSGGAMTGVAGGATGKKEKKAGGRKRKSHADE